MCFFFFFLMIRRPPRSTQSRSSAASDVYKRQALKVPHKTCKKKGLPAQTILICAIVGGLTASLLSTVPLVDAAPVYDYDNGSWTDLYSDNTGTSARSQANVDTSDGKLKLTNSGGGFIAPFYTTGYVRTTSIGAEAGVKIARWGTVTLTRELPPDTSITVQVLDEGNQIYPCLLYTSDAADAIPCVDLGRRRSHK